MKQFEKNEFLIPNKCSFIPNPHQTVSFRSNPKLVFNPNQSEAHSKSIGTCNPNESAQSE